MPKTFVIVALALLIGAFAGFSAAKYFNRPPLLDYFERRNKNSYLYINPLLECDNGSYVSQDTYLKVLRRKLTNFINEKTKNPQLDLTAVYYRDLNNGPWFGINERKNFAPASLLKLPVMITYFKFAEKNPEILNQKFSIKEDYDYSSQNFIPETKIKKNDTLTTYELIERMIAHSDNQAYFVLNNNLESGKLLKSFTDLGLIFDKDTLNSYRDYISVKDYSSFFRILYNSSYLDRKYSEEALKLLSSSSFEDGIRAKIPNTIKISHKFGERSYEDGVVQLHDCGIVYLPKKPYLICVMSRGTDFKELSRNIQTISQIVYDEVSN